LHFLLSALLKHDVQEAEGLFRPLALNELLSNLGHDCELLQYLPLLRSQTGAQPDRQKAE
jgi:hypothetical protein